MDQVVIFKQIFDKVRNDLNYQWFYSELKRHNVSHYIYYLATENVHIVLKNDNTVLLKGLKNIVSVKFSKDRHLIETTSNKLKSREITFQEYRRNLAKAGVFGGLQISTNKKDITIPLIIHYYLLKASRKLHRSYHAKP
ncbi:Qin prophage [Escherichia coli]|nr:Qin prophage [Escherichia coli]